MLIWFKSLFTDMSAGTLLVMLSFSVVLALMFALGEMASRASESEAAPSALPPGGGRDLLASPLLPVVATPAEAGSAGSVRVMVPAGSFN